MYPVTGASGEATLRPWLRIPTQLVSREPCHSRCLEGRRERGREGEGGREEEEGGRDGRRGGRDGGEEEGEETRREGGGKEGDMSFGPPIPMLSPVTTCSGGGAHQMLHYANTLRMVP